MQWYPIGERLRKRRDLKNYQKHIWHKWFAWRPVKVKSLINEQCIGDKRRFWTNIESHNVRTIWLEYVYKVKDANWTYYAHLKPATKKEKDDLDHYG